jgi:hypothetical protein
MGVHDTVIDVVEVADAVTPMGAIVWVRFQPGCLALRNDVRMASVE